MEPERKCENNAFDSSPLSVSSVTQAHQSWWRCSQKFGGWRKGSAPSWREPTPSWEQPVLLITTTMYVLYSLPLFPLFHDKPTFHWAFSVTQEKFLYENKYLSCFLPFVWQTQERDEDQRILNVVGESLRLLGNTLVALSDLRCNLAAQPPRHLHVVRPVTHYTSPVLLQSGLPHIPIPVSCLMI